jgi:hypothetical protein
MPIPVIIIGFFIIFVWLGIASYYLYKLINSYTFFTRGVQKKTLEGVLTNLVRQTETTKEDIANIMKRYDTMEKNELVHIQKIGLLRFNPFKDTGGDQSFILVLTDANDTGVMLTSLYSRAGTRWYAKRIEKGKGVEHALSDEEKKALQAAEKIRH